MNRNSSWLLLATALTLGLCGIDRPARAQGPTIEEVEPHRPAAGATGLGRAPGSGESLLGEAPGSGAGGLGGPPQEILGGRPGASTPRVPAAISTPGATGPAAPSGEALALPQPLQVQPPPVYGTLDFPSVAEDLGPPEGLSLDQAIETLVRSNLLLRAQAFELPQADADILTASLRANPILYADAQLVPYGSYSEQRPGGQIQYDLNISYPLDVTHKRRARILVACRAKRVLEAQYQDAVRLQIANLYTAYVNALAARQAVRYAEAGVEGLDQILRPLEAQLRAGRITPGDYNRVRLQRDTAEIARFDAEENLRRTLRDLATLLGLPPAQAEDLQLRGTLRDEAPPPPTADGLIPIALDARPDLVAYRLGIRRAAADVGLARANRLNDVYVLYQPYTFQDNSPFGVKSATSWALGVTVPLPLYNRNQGNIRRAELNVAQTQAELAALERQVVNEVQHADREYRVSLEAVRRVEDVLQPAAVEVLRTVRRQYEEGSIDVIAFVTARLEYNQVVKQYLDALIRHRRSMLELNTAVGRRILP